MEDVYEPLERYDTEFQAKFDRLSQELFDRLVAASGVDATSNAKTIAELRQLESRLSAAQGRRRLWQCLLAAAILAIIFSALVCVFAYQDLQNLPEGASSTNGILLFLGGLAGAILSIVLLYKVVYAHYRRIAATIETLQTHISQKTAEAWEQMAPLNQLYDWDMSAKLIAQTVPRIQLDPYFTVQRLQELQQHFGWDGSSNDRSSVLFAQSGSINDNPFVFGHLRKMQWGEKTYTGSKQISWTERVRDSKGNYYSVRRYETLVARVTKPIPLYHEEKFLLYGNEAAPRLTFSRQPSKLSGSDGGIIDSLRKKHTLKKLQDFSRNLEDESQYTLMGNHDFEVLFHATDRNDEIEFRLLFTPLAQTQMLKILQDRKIGFGDDFSFVKQRKLNFIYPQHLNNVDLDTDPKKFAHYDLVQARAFFLRTQAEYFKAVYFSLAPLLSIPLYQQTRTRASIYADQSARQASFWEHESLANYHGEQHFQHPQCITHSILKTRCLSQDDGLSAIAVTASGYKGITRTDYQNILGGDGHIHRVDVQWTEYLPVQQTKSMLLTEQPGVSLQEYRQQSPATAEKWPQRFQRKKIDWARGIYRRSILSCLD